MLSCKHSTSLFAMALCHFADSDCEYSWCNLVLLMKDSVQHPTHCISCVALTKLRWPLNESARVCRGPYIRMLDALAKTYMAKLKDPQKPFTKDEDREFILRFFALSNKLKEFKRLLYQFLNAEIQQRQHLDAETVRSYEMRFRKTFDLVRSSDHQGHATIEPVTKALLLTSYSQ